MSLRPARPGEPLVSVLLVLLPLSFAAGVAVERLGVLPGSRARALAGLQPTFDEAWQLIHRYYVGRSALRDEPLTAAAIEGVVNSLGDWGHTRYLTPEEVERLQTSLKGNLEGIGARMTMRKKRAVVVQTLPGSPARRAGLRPGDVLLEVDGKSVVGWPLSRVVEVVRGPAGTQVQLKIARGEPPQVLTLSLTRARVEVPVIAWRWLPGAPVVHLALLEFSQAADAQLRTVLQQLRQQKVQGLILDLRGNPGGLKDQAVAVASEFLASGVVFLERDAAGQEQPVPVRSGGLATDLPLVVLLDEGTASSAEIVAGALQDYERGKLVGTRTFGTGTVLREFALRDGSALLLAVAEWLTPKGRRIWHEGIQPDIEVSLPPETEPLFPDEERPLTAQQLAQSGDRQLLRALEVLREQLGLPQPREVGHPPQRP